MTDPQMIERLEDRTLLTASIRLKGTALFIEADAFGQQTYVETTAPGTVRIDLDNDGIFDNTFVGITDITAQLIGGVDSIGFGNIDISGKLTVKPGIGNDEVVFLGTVTCPVLVDLGKGNDSVFYDNATFLQSVTIRMAEGDDSILGAGATFFGPLTIDAGKGNDVVDHDAFFGGNAYFGGATITMGGGNDAYREIQGTFAGPATINLGVGNDSAVIAASDFFGNTKFDMSGGNDVLDFDLANNDLGIDANQFFAAATLLGGKGFDNFDESLQTGYAVPPTVKAFEDIFSDV
jgi:hypothetical protein